MSSSAEQSWRWMDDIDTGTDIIKRTVMVASFFVSTVIMWYYLKHKRKDLNQRQIVYLTAGGLGYALQVALKLFYIQRRRPVPIEEAASFTLLTPLMYLLPAYFAKSPTAKHKDQCNLYYMAGALLYGLGLFMETQTEYDRMIFKANALNQGKLYTLGWNAYSRNPNYFGEVLLFTGWNLFTFNHQLIFWESFLMALTFYTYHIPEKEAYLSVKYADEWQAYSQRVPALLPWLY